MRTKIHKAVAVALLLRFAATVQATVVVDFDAANISNAVNRSSDFLFDGLTATLDSTSSPGYPGQPVYGGFEEEGTSLWSANNQANAGVAGEASSGLYRSPVREQHS